MNEVSVTIAPDVWLGAQLGYPAYRVHAERCMDTDRDDAAAALERRLRERTLLYSRVPTEDVEICNYLVARDFRIVDTTITFEARNAISSSATAAKVRFATPDDRDAVMDVARRGFRYSRFHLDPNIPTATADAIKAAWAGNYFAGARGEFMVVSESGGRIAGFLQLLAPRGGPLTIDLIAVDEGLRGKGIARAMVAFACVRCPESIPMRVGTQAANIESIRFYESLGFRVIGSAYVLHALGCDAAAERR